MPSVMTVQVEGSILSGIVPIKDLASVHGTLNVLCSRVSPVGRVESLVILTRRS